MTPTHTDARTELKEVVLVAAAKSKPARIPAKARARPSAEIESIAECLRESIASAPLTIQRRADLVSAEQREQLQRYFKSHVSKWPAMVRLAWLRSLFGYIIRTPDERRKLERQLHRLIDRTRRELHGQWLESWGMEGVALPRGENVRMRRVRPGKKYTLHRRKARGEKPNSSIRTTSKDFASRWTPPQCVKDETLLDLGIHRAEHDGSISATVIRQIEQTKAQDEEAARSWAKRWGKREAAFGSSSGKHFTPYDGFYSRLSAPKMPKCAS